MGQNFIETLKGWWNSIKNFVIKNGITHTHIYIYNLRFPKILQALKIKITSSGPFLYRQRNRQYQDHNDAQNKLFDSNSNEIFVLFDDKQ